jgi:cytochrome c-type biogenesis protein CcmE
MNKIHQRRLIIIAIIACGLTLAASLILYALKQNINAFLTPSQLAETTINPGYTFRLGGMVKKKSVLRSDDGLNVQFTVTDFKRDLVVHYTGILPDLFREGSGVITEGELNAQGIFVARQVLAKHDENYMPKNVAEVMQQGEMKK